MRVVNKNNTSNSLTTLQQRPRQRQVSWGPPPIAQKNTTQLPFKIDETESCTKDIKKSHNL